MTTIKSTTDIFSHSPTYTLRCWFHWGKNFPWFQWRSLTFQLRVLKLGVTAWWMGKEKAGIQNHCDGSR